ncbi:peptidoglycan-binding protein [Kitasatospora sp. NPDC101155]|uniref:peptidoglycan-binding domain-containing protein n=1 Tax=Kitasatospora sp. NPDC101155 TaxID=3364097 RepID=UPI0038092EC4
MLSSGASGENLRTLQYLPVRHGATLTVDGAYGPAAQSAVTAFQSSAALRADGVVDARTWSRLLG